MNDLSFTVTVRGKVRQRQVEKLKDYADRTILKFQEFIILAALAGAEIIADNLEFKKEKK